MSSFYEAKYILLIISICLISSNFLIGCDNANQDTDGNLPVQESEDGDITDEDTDEKNQADTEADLPEEDTQGTDEEKLKEALSLIDAKKYPQAIGLLSQIENNEQAEELLEQLRYIISGEYIANLNVGVAALDNDDKVIIVTDNSIYEHYRYDEVTRWVDIKRLSFAGNRLDALDKNGFIHSTGVSDDLYDSIVKQLKSYTDLSLISTDADNYILLSNTGKLYIYSEKNYEFDKSKDSILAWEDVVDVVTGDLRIAVLKRDGTVYIAYADYLDYAFAEIAEWTDIIDISGIGGGPLAGLKSDGTVVVSTSYVKSLTFDPQYYDVSDWNDIIAISKSNTKLLGLKRDGTAVITGIDSRTQSEVSDWTDIVAIAAGDHVSYGLKSDGTLVMAGIKIVGDVSIQDVSGVNNLYVPVVEY